MAHTHTRHAHTHGTHTHARAQVLYKASKERFDAEPDFKCRAREAVTSLQSGDPAFAAAWARICDVSRREYAAIYKVCVCVCLCV